MLQLVTWDADLPFASLTRNEALFIHPTDGKGWYGSAFCVHSQKRCVEVEVFSSKVLTTSACDLPTPCSLLLSRKNEQGQLCLLQSTFTKGKF